MSRKILYYDIILVCLIMLAVKNEAAKTCSVVGRFPIVDTNCTSYLWCTAANGIIHTTTAFCPGTRLFNPQSQLCVETYTCTDYICENVLSPILNFLDPNDKTKKTYISCIYDSDYKTWVPVYHACENFVVQDPANNNQGYCAPTRTQVDSTALAETWIACKTCTAVGKFPIVNTNCQSYLSCTYQNEIFHRNEVACSGTNLFNPHLQECVASYKCTDYICADVSSSTIYFLDPNDKTTKTYISCEYDTDYQTRVAVFHTCDNFLVTNALNNYQGCCLSDPTHGCSAVAPPTGKTCTTLGKFPIVHTKCRSYLMCTTYNGVIQTSEASCAGTTIFNPRLQVCEVSYICTDYICENVLSSNIYFLDPNDKTMKTYISCVYDTAYQTRVAVFHTCDNFLVTNVANNYQGCCLSDPTQECHAVAPPTGKTCTAVGKFPIVHTNCRSYLTCTTSNGVIQSSEASCIGTTIFNPRLQVCQNSYICTDYICENVLSSTIYFLDPNDKTMKTYISCKYDTDYKTMVAVFHTCDNFLVTNVANNYQGCCLSDPTQECPAVPPLTGKTCTALGKFPIVHTKCRSYLMCTTSNGVIQSSEAACTGTTVFNPRLQVCQDSYICTDYICENVLSSTIYFLDPNDKTRKSYISCKYDTDYKTWVAVFHTCTEFVVTNAANNNEGCCSSDPTCQTAVGVLPSFAVPVMICVGFLLVFLLIMFP